jgi:hypothetical protein
MSLEVLAISRRADPAMGVLGYSRNEADYYPTPAWCTEALLTNLSSVTGEVWEPACGEGHISTVLEGRGLFVTSSDLRFTGYGAGGVDFLAAEDEVDNIITNPPYTLAEEFIIHALEATQTASGKVAMLLRNEYDSARSRTYLFRHPTFALKLALTKRPRWIEGSIGSPRHNYAWYVWDWTTLGQAPTIKWDQ